MKIVLFATAVLSGLVLLSPPRAIAADGAGNFAIRGAGRIACSELLDGLEKKDERLTIFATWLEGYITATNQLAPDTFDITPWQTTELLLALAGRACAGSPQANFMDTIGRLIAEMRPLRLQERTALLRIAEPDKVQVHYRTTVERVRRRLEELGYVFETSSVVGQAAHDEMRRHLLHYQAESGLPPSGQMDQHTLLNLFVRTSPDESPPDSAPKSPSDRPAAD